MRVRQRQALGRLIKKRERVSTHARHPIRRIPVLKRFSGIFRHRSRRNAVFESVNARRRVRQVYRRGRDGNAGRARPIPKYTHCGCRPHAAASLQQDEIISLSNKSLGAPQSCWECGTEEEGGMPPWLLAAKSATSSAEHTPLASRADKTFGGPGEASFLRILPQPA